MFITYYKYMISPQNFKGIVAIAITIGSLRLPTFPPHGIGLSSSLLQVPLRLCPELPHALEALGRHRHHGEGRRHGPKVGDVWGAALEKSMRNPWGYPSNLSLLEIARQNMTKWFNSMTWKSTGIIFSLEDAMVLNIVNISKLPHLLP